MNINKEPTRSYIKAVLAVTLILLLGYAMRLREQCPYGLTQEQIESADCIIGASIGPMIDFKYSIALAVIVTLYYILAGKRRSSKK